jgi:hypothetical protein
MFLQTFRACGAQKPLLSLQKNGQSTFFCKDKKNNASVAPAKAQ